MPNIAIYTYNQKMSVDSGQLLVPNPDGTFQVCSSALTSVNSIPFRPLTDAEKSKAASAQSFYDNILNGGGLDWVDIRQALGGPDLGDDFLHCIRAIRKALRGDGLDGTIADESRQIAEALG